MDKDLASLKRPEQVLVDPVLGVSAQVVRWPLILINLPLLCVALATVALSIHIAMAVAPYKALIGHDSLNKAFPAFAFAAFIICVLSFLGGHGAFKRNKSQVCIYVVFLILSIDIFVAGVALVFVEGRDYEEALVRELPFRYENYTVPDVQHELHVPIDKVQRGLRCCGVDISHLNVHFNVTQEIMDAVKGMDQADVLIDNLGRVLKALDMKPWAYWGILLFLGGDPSRVPRPKDFVKYQPDKKCCDDANAPGCNADLPYVYEKLSSRCAAIDLNYTVPESCCQLDSDGDRKQCTRGPQTQLLNRKDCLKESLEFLHWVIKVVKVAGVVLIVLTVVCIILGLVFACC